jgi:hypothetical protein
MQAMKETTTPLLDLIYSKRQEHQRRQNRRQMPSVVPVIMFKMVALIFKRTVAGNLPDVRRIGVERIFDQDHLQIRITCVERLA